MVGQFSQEGIPQGGVLGRMIEGYFFWKVLEEGQEDGGEVGQ